MLAHIEDRDRYNRQSYKNVFVVKLRASVRAIKHLENRTAPEDVSTQRGRVRINSTV